MTFCFLTEPNTHGGPEYDRYNHYIDVWGGVLPAPRISMTAGSTS